MGRRPGKLLTASPGWGFLCELALALGLTLAGVLRLSEAELNVWAAYRERHGLPADRLLGAVVNAGAYTGGTFGGKLKPADLLPRFREAPPRSDLAAVRAWFMARAEKGEG